MKNKKPCFVAGLSISLCLVSWTSPGSAASAERVNIPTSRVLPLPGSRRNVTFTEWADLNDKGEVTRGIVRHAALGTYPENRNLWFSGEVAFSSEGLVVSGILEFKTALGVVGEGRNTFFKGGTMVRFSAGTPSPGVIEGVLAEGASFVLTDGRFVDIPADSHVTFNASGALLKYGPSIRVFKSHRYALTDTAGNWEDVNKEAVRKGGHLVVIDSAEENKWLVANFGDGPFWIGLFQSPKSAEPRGGWRWVDNAPLAYSNWEGGQPDNFTGRDNYAFFLQGSGGRWHDVPVEGWPANSSHKGIIEFR